MVGRNSRMENSHWSSFSFAMPRLFWPGGMPGAGRRSRFGERRGRLARNGPGGWQRSLAPAIDEVWPWQVPGRWAWRRRGARDRRAGPGANRGPSRSKQQSKQNENKPSPPRNRRGLGLFVLLVALQMAATPKMSYLTEINRSGS